MAALDMGTSRLQTAARMRQRPWFTVIALAVLTLAASPAWAAAAEGATSLQPVLVSLVLVLIGAKLGGSLFARMGQSPVLGELLAGVVIGNLGLFGYHGFDALRDLEGIHLLAEIGVLFLLFEVGLHTNIRQMMAVGASSLIVAVLGVVAPMVLGYFCSAWFFPHHNVLTHWFVGATLCATSVGITARVLQDLGRTASVEGRIILGAAVIDDVLGLIVLAVVSGIIQAADAGRAFEPMSGLLILFKAVAFLAVAVVVGRWLSSKAFRVASRLSGGGLLLTTALAMCFGFAFAAGAVGLAPIVGAFAAGLVLDDVHYQDLKARDEKKRGIPELLEPLSAFLVPVFFVLMGMRVDLSVFGTVGVLGFAAVLTLAAVIGKQICAFGVLERGADLRAIGRGMIPVSYKQQTLPTKRRV